MFFIASDPFTIYIFSVFLSAYVLLRITGDGDQGLQKSIVFLFKLAGLGALGVGMGAVFSFNSLYGIINSPRVAGQSNAVNVFVSSPVFELTDPLQGLTALMRLFSNDLMGTGSDFTGWYNYLEAPNFYAGLLPLLLLPQILFSPGRKKKITFIAFLCVWSIPVIFPFPGMRYMHLWEIITKEACLCLFR